MGIVAARHVTAERMDDPGLDAGLHEGALRGLRRLNRISGVAQRVGGVICSLGRVRRARGGARLTLLDVACGGGDVPIGVARVLRQKGIDVQLALTDRSPTALARAQVGAREAGIDACVLPGAAPEALPEGSWDVVTNSLFLHHLERAEVVATLREMARRARVGVVVSDLRRSGVAWGVTWVMCRLVTRSRIVHYDGPVSVRAAWTCAELREMAEEAGMTGARVEACWPWRMVLVWERT